MFAQVKKLKWTLETILKNIIKPKSRLSTILMKM